tara:strand:- start:282 stop:1034 length:753 start_codon:yes stop_codon:yes gene_type:complete
MTKIIGLSHIVFTKVKTSINDDIFLKSNYQTPKKFQFDHSSIKSNMIRDKLNKLSNLNFYKSNRSAISVEILHSKTNFKRPKYSYGIIDKKIKTDSLKENYSDLDFLGKNMSTFSPSLNCYIIKSTNIINTDYGCWYSVNNFEQHVEIFEKSLGLKLISNDGKIAKFKCVIINTFFSPFTILIIKSEKQTDYFNDDAGLSTLGFICKNLPKKIDKPFCLSEELDIILFTKKLKGKFIYDNNGIAYELLKI